MHAGDLLWHELSPEELLSHFVGRPTEGHYSDDSGFTETIRSDLTTLYADQYWQGEGLLFIDGREMCFAYPTEPLPSCFIVWRRSANCYDGYARRQAPAQRASAIARTLGVDWDVRFWRADEPPTCPRAPTS